jgi:hypothetical protein
LLSADELDAGDLAKENLVVAGSPTRKMNLLQELRPILRSLPRQALKRKAFGALDSSGRMSGWLPTGSPRDSDILATS